MWLKTEQQQCVSGRLLDWSGRRRGRERGEGGRETLEGRVKEKGRKTGRGTFLASYYSILSSSHHHHPSSIIFTIVTLHYRFLQYFVVSCMIAVMTVDYLPWEQLGAISTSTITSIR